LRTRAAITTRDDLVHWFLGGYLAPALGARSRMIEDKPNLTFEADTTS
jgi:hypothetical protein